MAGSRQEDWEASHLSSGRPCRTQDVGIADFVPGGRRGRDMPIQLGKPSRCSEGGRGCHCDILDRLLDLSLQVTMMRMRRLNPYHYRPVTNYYLIKMRKKQSKIASVACELSGSVPRLSNSCRFQPTTKDSSKSALFYQVNGKKRPARPSTVLLEPQCRAIQGIPEDLDEPQDSILLILFACLGRYIGTCR